MTFQITKQGYNIQDLARQIGYRPLGVTPAGELNCVRPLGADYPRFHIYFVEKPDRITVNLHLDQKRPSYGRETAHSGDYDSETVRDEVARIQELLAER